MKRYAQVLFALLFSSLPLFAIEKTIGVPQFSVTENLFDGNEPHQLLVRTATTRSFFKKEQGDYKLDILHRFQILPDTGVVGFEISRETSFSNGVKILPEDILFSLQRCEQGRVTKNIEYYRRTRETYLFKAHLSQENFEEEREQLFQLMSSCPLLPKNVVMELGELWGSGTNTISLGSYMIEELRLGKHLTLRRRLHPPKGELTPAQISIRSYPDTDQALSSLRNGTYDLFFMNNQELSVEIGKDETLGQTKCSNYIVVYRKGLRVRCNPDLVLTDLIYDYERLPSSSKHTSKGVS